MGIITVNYRRVVELALILLVYGFMLFVMGFAFFTVMKIVW
jgi:hypothetical protein